MAAYYDFLCDACGYRVEMRGGEEAGMTCCTQTLVCLDCQTVCDAVTRHMNFGAEALDIAPRCPKRKHHRIQA